MKRSELIAKIAEKTNQSKADAQKSLDLFLEIITESLASGDSVEFGNDFGKLVVVDVKERTGRNPQNGAALVTPAHKKPGFKPSKALKEIVKSA